MSRINEALCSDDRYVSLLKRLPVLAALVLASGLGSAPAGARQVQNDRVSAVLGMFDIDGRDGPDESVDQDGDGLPDTWEVGGLDEQNTDVAFPAPSAIVPGSPPTSIFARRAVRTSATARDTDGDLLSDFIEVFGLKFIDDNFNGVLDDACARDANGKCIFDVSGRPLRRRDSNGNPIGEWYDFNNDGMPSIGEYPAVNILIPGRTDNADFDGFIFTDPTNPDTDGDGVLDGVDVDPLINPNAFGIRASDADVEGADVDKDNDGLGDFMDLGFDRPTTLDNPSDLRRVIALFRPDLFDVFSRENVRIPEALIEDLLGADWNGDGLFRLTDVRVPHFGVVTPPTRSVGGIDLFSVLSADPKNPTPSALGFSLTVFPNTFVRTTYYNFDERGEGGVDAPLPYQELLLPSRRDENVFISDPRIWTVLYAWRMPGFDIDGNGFIGFDGVSLRDQNVDVNGVDVLGSDPSAPSTDILVAADAGVANLDGLIESDLLSGCGQGACGGVGASLLSLTLAGIFLMRPRRNAGC